MTLDTAVVLAALVLALVWPALSHPVVTMSEPGAASTAPALSHTYGRGASVSDRTCSIEDCANKATARGWCPTHYSRWRLHGDPTVVLIAQFPAGAPLAFVAEAATSATDECIIWPYFVGKNGYGKVAIGGRSRYVHRVVLGSRTWTTGSSTTPTIAVSGITASSSRPSRCLPSSGTAEPTLR